MIILINPQLCFHESHWHQQSGLTFDVTSIVVGGASNTLASFSIQAIEIASDSTDDKSHEQ